MSFMVVDSLTLYPLSRTACQCTARYNRFHFYLSIHLAAKGLNPNQVIITSVLRTENDVKRLPSRQRK